MSNTRKAIVIFDEFSSMTILKPFSDEYRNQLFVINEDAFGEAVFTIRPISELRREVSMTAEEFDEIIKDIL